MNKTVKIHPAEDFKTRSKAVLDNPGQRRNFRGAMDFYRPNGALSFLIKRNCKVCESWVHPSDATAWLICLVC